jgi:hypothetical protein
MSDIPAKPAEHEVEKGDWVPFGLAASLCSASSGMPCRDRCQRLLAD